MNSDIWKKLLEHLSFWKITYLGNSFSFRSFIVIKTRLSMSYIIYWLKALGENAWTPSSEMTLVWPIYCFSHARKISQTKVKSFLLIWSYYVYNYLFEKYMILFFIREFKHSISKPSSKYCAVMLLVIMHFSITVMSKYSEAIFEFLLYKFFIVALRRLQWLLVTVMAVFKFLR